MTDVKTTHLKTPEIHPISGFTSTWAFSIPTWWSSGSFQGIHRLKLKKAREVPFLGSSTLNLQRVWSRATSVPRAHRESWSNLWRTFDRLKSYQKHTKVLFCRRAASKQLRKPNNGTKMLNILTPKLAKSYLDGQSFICLRLQFQLPRPPQSSQQVPKVPASQWPPIINLGPPKCALDQYLLHKCAILKSPTMQLLTYMVYFYGIWLCGAWMGHSTHGSSCMSSPDSPPSRRVVLSTNYLPDTCDETVSKVMTPRVTLAGTQSTSIQNETHEMATIRIDGR